MRAKEIRENIPMPPKRMEYMVEKLIKSKKMERIALGKYRILEDYFLGELTQDEKKKKIHRLKDFWQTKEARKIMSYIYSKSEFGMKNARRKFEKERIFQEIIKLSIEAGFIEQIYESDEERYSVKDLAKTWYSVLSQESKTYFGCIFLKVSTLSVKQLQQVIEEGIQKEIITEEKGFYTVT